MGLFDWWINRKMQKKIKSLPLEAWVDIAKHAPNAFVLTPSDYQKVIQGYSGILGQEDVEALHNIGKAIESSSNPILAYRQEALKKLQLSEFNRQLLNTFSDDQFEAYLQNGPNTAQAMEFAKTIGARGVVERTYIGATLDMLMIRSWGGIRYDDYCEGDWFYAIRYLYNTQPETFNLSPDQISEGIESAGGRLVLQSMRQSIVQEMLNTAPGQNILAEIAEAS